ncbi:uncharacterized protein LOC105206708 isoform X3 [Solenopsis invicta]|nr:uncharacterized protein LOC105206708 isoform X3 [Solenopsis invicta]
MKMPLKLSHGLLITNVIGRRFQKKKLLQQLKNITEPNTCWPSHDIKTFRNSSYDNYGTAREKARKAEFKSELNSDTERERENIKAPKRKIDSKMLFSCSDDSDKECINTKLPTPPIMQAEEYFQEIIRQQTYFKTQLWQIADDFKVMKDKLLQQFHQRPNEYQREESIFSVFQLPFNTVDDLEQRLEDFLNQAKNFEASVKEVSRIGGKNPYEFIKRNCTHLLTNELAEKYSWLGARQKRKFAPLKLADLLIVAGQETDSNYTKKVLEEAIQKWLRRAKERMTAELKKL